MFTLKIKWYRYEFQNISLGELADETILFISADQVSVHGEVTDMDKMKSWTEKDFMDYHVVLNKEGEFVSRLIAVEKDNKTTWYLASHAWLLGADGKTIENLIP